MWPWPRWQPPRPRTWGGGRSWLLSLSTDLNLATWLCLSACEAGERGPPSKLPRAAKIQGLLLQKNESRFWGQPAVSATFSWFLEEAMALGLSQLFTQFLYHCNFFNWVINTSNICRARESFLVYVYVSFVVVQRTWFYSAKSHWMTAKCCENSKKWKMQPFLSSWREGTD